MAELPLFTQGEIYQSCAESIQFLTSAFGVLLAVLTLTALVIGFLFGDSYSVYKYRKQLRSHNEDKCPNCDYDFRDDNKGRGI